MIIFSFIMSCIMAVILVTFTIAIIVASYKQKKDEELENRMLINGFNTYDINDSIGGINEEKK